MYQRQEFTIISKLDELPLSVLTVLPEEGQPVERVVQLVHGMAEYKERYLPLMEYLAGRGCACVIHDHRGHGKSMRDGEDKGFLYGAGGAGLVADALQITDHIRKTFPGVPRVLFGHSMGSLVARCMLREADLSFSAAVLSGPPTRNPAAAFGLALARFQRGFGPRRKGKLLQAMAFGGYVAKFPESPCAWVCGDPAVVKAYEEDPLCGFTFTVDGFVGLMELMSRTYEKAGWCCDNPALPILFLGGSQDPCIGGADKFNEAMDFLRGVGYQDVAGALFDDMRHEICNEQDKLRVFARIETFLREKAD